MKTVITAVLCLLCSTMSMAQTNALSGNWEIFQEAFHYAAPTGRVTIGADAKTTWYTEGSKDYWAEIQAAESGCNLQQRSLVNFTQFSHVWSYQCASSDTLETRSLIGTSFGNPHMILANFQILRAVKQRSDLSLSCFIEETCNFGSGMRYLKPVTERAVLEDQLFIGFSTNNILKVEEIRFTPEAIEVLILFTTGSEPYSGRLHPPGADFAFFLRDSHGNVYNLNNQYGWNGDEAGGYGLYQIPKETELHLILYFERPADVAAVNNLSLLEGSCESSCWNFYDIRLKDQE